MDILKKTRLVHILILGSATGLLLLFALAAIIRESYGNHIVIQHHSTYPPQSKEAILELYHIVGMDRYTRIITSPYSKEKLDKVIESLNSSDPLLKEQAFYILEEMVKQLDIPVSATDQVIKPYLVAAQQLPQRANSDDHNHKITRLSEYVIWQLQLKQTTDDEQRLSFLRDALERNGYYYQFEAIDNLVKMGTKEAKAVLESKINEGKEHGEDERLLERMYLGVKKIDLLQQLSSLDQVARAEKLRSAISQYKTYFGDAIDNRTEFVTWAIRTLGKFPGEEAITGLEEIWSNKSYATGYRFEAQEALIRRQAIKPEERIISFLE